MIRKHARLAFAVLLTAVISMCGLSVYSRTAYASGDDTWMTAYGDFILNRECDRIGYPDYLPDGYDIVAMTDGTDKLEYAGYDYDPIWFTLYDMDGNNIPELIVFNGYGYMAGNRCHVYTFEDGGMQYLGTMGRRELMFQFAPDRTYPGLILTDGNMGYYTTEYWYIDNGCLCCETVESVAEEESEESSNSIITRETGDDGLYNWYHANTFQYLDHWDYETLNQYSWQDFVDRFCP